MASIAEQNRRDIADVLAGRWTPKSTQDRKTDPTQKKSKKKNARKEGGKNTNRNPASTLVDVSGHKFKVPYEYFKPDMMPHKKASEQEEWIQRLLPVAEVVQRKGDGYYPIPSDVDAKQIPEKKKYYLFNRANYDTIVRVFFREMWPKHILHFPLVDAKTPKMTPYQMDPAEQLATLKSHLSMYEKK